MIVSNESRGAVLMKLTAMYTSTATVAVTKMALGIAIAQYLTTCPEPMPTEREIF